MIVLDASLALSWFFEDERSAGALALLHRVAAGGASVPGLWRLEVANGLQVAGRRGRLTISARNEAIAALRDLPISVDPETDLRAWDAILGLADRFGLTAYDAAYLELSLRLGLPLATRDQALTRACRSAGVDVADGSET
ncbi:MAG: type II toxin-antitoxin system VapC family toxin [Alphaproteobacteria bacterium]|nr:type II toxin-antitoxin system VapC family toxin [Alphaproteobacteria bacterium]